MNERPRGHVDEAGREGPRRIARGSGARVPAEGIGPIEDDELDPRLRRPPPGRGASCSRRCRSARRRPGGRRRARPGPRGPPAAASCARRRGSPRAGRIARICCHSPPPRPRPPVPRRPCSGPKSRDDVHAQRPQHVDRVPPVRGHRGRMRHEAHALAARGRPPSASTRSRPICTTGEARRATSRTGVKATRALTTASATRRPRPGSIVVVLARRVHAVRQQDDEQPSLRIHPERGAREARCGRTSVGESRLPADE